MKIEFTPGLVEEIKAILDKGIEEVDRERGVRIFGHLSGQFSHLRVVLVDGETSLPVDRIVVPLPAPFSRGYLGE